MSQAQALPEQMPHSQADQWRQAFDLSFAAAPRDVVLVQHDFLAVRIGASDYALRLDEVAGLQTLKALTPCPSRQRGLLGLVSFQGDVLPIYDLCALLGHAPAAGPARLPGWWIATKGAPLGLAFDTFERFLRLPPEAVGHAGDTDARAHCAETLRCDERLRPLISIASILRDIRATVQAQQPPQLS